MDVYYNDVVVLNLAQIKVISKRDKNKEQAGSTFVFEKNEKVEWKISNEKSGKNYFATYVPVDFFVLLWSDHEPL